MRTCKCTHPLPGGPSWGRAQTWLTWQARSPPPSVPPAGGRCGGRGPSRQCMAGEWQFSTALSQRCNRLDGGQVRCTGVHTGWLRWGLGRQRYAPTSCARAPHREPTTAHHRASILQQHARQASSWGRWLVLQQMQSEATVAGRGRRPTWRASASDRAPTTWHSMRHVAPSPSHAIDLARPCEQGCGRGRELCGSRGLCLSQHPEQQQPPSSGPTQAPRCCHTRMRLGRGRGQKPQGCTSPAGGQ